MSDTVVLEDRDGLAEVAGLGRAAAVTFADLPAFELGVRAFAGAGIL
ncbi:hypothetical protein [Nonomuraea indica]|uniref:Uncharacterized protein n=1 Tax=Nonomuraea indica TaxID=1581193 RepID=A0ABW8A2F0_9ACTN